LAIRPVLFVVAAKCALHLAVAGRHLQGGYVEFPPVTAQHQPLCGQCREGGITHRLPPLPTTASRRLWGSALE
jgi:hypothetical protein